MSERKRMDRERGGAEVALGAALGVAAWLWFNSSSGRQVRGRLMDVLDGRRRRADEELEYKIAETRERMRAGEVVGAEGVGGGV